MTQRVTLNFLGAKGCEILLRYKMGREVKDVQWGLEGRAGRTTKGQENRETIPTTSVISSHTTLYISAILHSSPSSLSFQKWLQPQEENQAYGSVLLDTSTTLAGLLWKIPFYLLQLYDLNLSFPMKCVSTDFYEHRQKLLQPPPHPQIFQTNCSCYVGLFVSKATVYI